MEGDILSVRMVEGQPEVLWSVVVFELGGEPGVFAFYLPLH